MASGSAPKQKNVDMVNGPLWNKILIYFIPVLCSSIVTRLIHSMDVAVISKFSGTTELAAMGATSAISGFFSNLVAGFGVGAAVIVGQLVGARKIKTAKKAMHNSMFIGAVGGIIVAIIGLIFLQPILRMLGTPQEIIHLSSVYLTIIFLAKPFFLIYTMGIAISQSKGDSKTPLLCSVCCSVTNLTLNLLFVVTFNWGVFGVGLATFIAHFVQFAIIVTKLMKSDDEFRISLKEIKPDKYIISRIVKFGLPASLQGILTPAGNAVILSAYNSLGTSFIASNSLGTSIEGITFCVTGAFTATASVFVSQNYGAGKLDRCKKTLLITIGFSTLFTYIFDFLILYFKDYSIGFLTNDKVIVELVAQRILYVAIGHFFLIVVDQLTSALRGFGKTLYSSIISISGICLLRVVWVYTVFANFKSYTSLIMVYPVTFFVTAVAMFVTYLIIYKKIKLQLNRANAIRKG